MPAPFDPSRYTTAPRIGIDDGIPLARALAQAAPRQALAGVTKAAARLVQVADEAQAAKAERQRLATEGEAPQPIDQEADRSWSSLRVRLESFADLPVERYPRAGRAQEIHDLLFGEDGLNFLKLRYVEQHTAADTLLQRIDKEQLARDIDELCGPEFLQNVREVHKRYGAMVQETLLRDKSGPNLRDQVDALRRAIVDYATKIVATVEEDDAATARAAEDALRPIDTHRAQAQRRAGTKKPGSEPPTQ